MSTSTGPLYRHHLPPSNSHYDRSRLPVSTSDPPPSITELDFNINKDFSHNHPEPYMNVTTRVGPTPKARHRKV
ncbi:hypothetical protein LXL04_028427 [Taraxacum kok-saghyz]